MHLLEQFIFEVAPKLIRWQDIAPFLEGLRVPVQLAIRQDKVAQAARLISRALKRFGDVNIRIGNEGLSVKNVHAMYNDQTDRIVISIPLVAIMYATDDHGWDAVTKAVSVALAHELIHNWQKLRRGIETNRSQREFVHYIDDPEEITAWAHDVVNEVGPDTIIQTLAKVNEPSLRGLQWLYYTGLSASLESFMDMLLDIRDEYKRTQVRKRFIKTLIAIASN